MTRSLETAMAEVAKLPPEEQDRIARWLLDELRDEDLWTRAFSESQDALSRLAAEAKRERDAGKARELDPDTM